MLPRFNIIFAYVFILSVFARSFFVIGFPDIDHAHKYIKVRKLKMDLSPVTGRKELQGCEILRITNFLEDCFTDGYKIVSPVRRPHLTSLNIIFQLLLLISVRI
jgi:hypothetical protein